MLPKISHSFKFILAAQPKSECIAVHRTVSSNAPTDAHNMYKTSQHKWKKPLGPKLAYPKTLSNLVNSYYQLNNKHIISQWRISSSLVQSKILENLDCLESCVSYAIALTHNVKGGCWWYSSRGLIFPLIFHWLFLLYDRQHQSDQMVSDLCTGHKRVSLNSSLQKIYHPMTFIDPWWILE